MAAGLLTLLDDIGSGLGQPRGGKRQGNPLANLLALSRGAFLNKLILVPLILLIILYMPELLGLILLPAGALLCREGAARLLALLRGSRSGGEGAQIRSAVISDFMLSAVIMSVVAGIFAGAGVMMLALVLSVLALLLTIIIFTLPALLVKLSDAAAGLQQAEGLKPLALLFNRLAGGGLRMLSFALALLMLLLGGSVIVQGLPVLTELVHFAQRLGADISIYVALFAPSVLSGILGLVLGLLMIAGLSFIRPLR